MPQDEVLEKVRGWLETSGRALELRTARAFRHYGARPVEQSFSYTDPITGKQREGDVRAHYPWRGARDVACALTAIIECKKGADKPWVAFYDRSLMRAPAIESWVAYAHGPFTTITEPLAGLWIGQPPFDEVRVATHLATAFGDDNRSQTNPANDAVRQVMGATDAERQQYVRTQHDKQRGFVVLPVVVTSAPLVKCELDARGEIQLEKASSVVVSGPWVNNESRRVFVLNETAIPEFSAALARLAARAQQQAAGDLIDED